VGFCTCNVGGDLNTAELKLVLDESIKILELKLKVISANSKNDKWFRERIRVYYKKLSVLKKQKERLENG